MVRKEVLFDAPRDEVWSALTDPERLEDWFANDVELDLRPGGGASFRWSNGEERQATVTEVEPERRLDYWIGAVCECFLEMDITTQVRADFDCSVQRGQLDTIGIDRVQGSAQHVYRRKASVARSAANYYYLLCKTDNDWTVMQNGHASRMRPMDLVLLDSRRCYEFNFPVNADTLSLELPIHWVESWISNPERRIGQRVDGHVGWARRSAHLPAN